MIKAAGYNLVIRDNVNIIECIIDIHNSSIKIIYGHDIESMFPLSEDDVCVCQHNLFVWVVDLGRRNVRSCLSVIFEKIPLPVVITHCYRVNICFISRQAWDLSPSGRLFYDPCQGPLWKIYLKSSVPKSQINSVRCDINIKYAFDIILKINSSMSKRLSLNSWSGNHKD